MSKVRRGRPRRFQGATIPKSIYLPESIWRLIGETYPGASWSYALERMIRSSKGTRALREAFREGDFDPN